MGDKVRHLSRSGGGSGFGWSGQVEFRGDLPTTLGTPAIGTIYLVEKPTTFLGFTTYQSGLYIRDTNTATLSDWRRLNVKVQFTDSEFTIVSALDQSKQAKFDMSLVTTSTTRTYTWQDKSGTIALLSDISAQDLASVLTAGNNANPGQNIVLHAAGKYVIDDDQVTPISSNLELSIDAFKALIETTGLAGASRKIVIKSNSPDGIEFETPGTVSYSTGVLKGILSWTGITANRTYQFQDASGILAFLSDIPGAGTSPWHRTFYTYNMDSPNNYTWNSVDVDAGTPSVLNDRWRFIGCSDTNNQEQGAYMNFKLPSNYTAGRDIRVTLTSTAASISLLTYAMVVGLVGPNGTDFGDDADTEWIEQVVAPLSGGFDIVKTVYTFDGTNLNPGDDVSVMVYRNPNNVLDILTSLAYIGSVLIEEVTP